MAEDFARGRNDDLTRDTNSLASTQRYHWKVPVTALTSLLLGVLAACGHHVLYQTYDGSAVSNDNEQRWLLRAGTALAFLFKTLIAIATSTSFVQHLWLTISRQPLKINEIDQMFDILKDVTGFGLVLRWLRNPLLATTALVTWTIPIAAIITPGTLTVRRHSSLVNEMIPTSVLNMHTENFYSWYDHVAGILGGPSTSVTRTTISAMTQGSILPLSPRYANSSYTIQFYGPAIQCTPWPSSDLKDFQKQICDYMSQYNQFAFQFSDCESILYLLPYLSWTPSRQNNITNPPFQAMVLQNSSFPRKAVSKDLFVILYGGGSGVAMTCSYRNASYTAGFTFNNNTQSINITNKAFVDFEEGFDAGTDYITSSNVLQASYRAVWQAFCSLLIGYIYYEHGPSAGLPTDVFQTQILNSVLNPLNTTLDSASSFGTATEELFDNITLSYLSNNDLATQSLVNVTYNQSQNVYSYQAEDLWKAYGIGIAAASLCALIGLRAIIISSLTFKNSWSTIFRTTRAIELDSVLALGRRDLNGAEPGSETMQDAMIIYTKDGFRLHTDIELRQRAGLRDRNNKNQDSNSHSHSEHNSEERSVISSTEVATDPGIHLESTAAGESQHTSNTANATPLMASNTANLGFVYINSEPPYREANDHQLRSIRRKPVSQESQSLMAYPDPDFGTKDIGTDEFNSINTPSSSG